MVIFNSYVKLPEGKFGMGKQWLCPSQLWWMLENLQIKDESSEVAWHWDRDYTLESSGVNIHPMLGTVTYLSQGEEKHPQLSCSDAVRAVGAVAAMDQWNKAGEHKP